eukprot:6507051-Pyramimonas_sp.AAC.2
MSARFPPLVEPVGRELPLHVHDICPGAAASGATMQMQRATSVDRMRALASEHPLTATPLIHRKGK